MTAWCIERRDTPGVYYKNVGNVGIQWTDWKPHAAYGDKRHMIAVAQWLKAKGYAVRIS